MNPAFKTGTSILPNALSLTREVFAVPGHCTTADVVNPIGDLLHGCLVGNTFYDDKGTVLSRVLGDGGTDGPGRAGNVRPR